MYSGILYYSEMTLLPFSHLRPGRQSSLQREQEIGKDYVESAPWTEDYDAP